jgi:(1->4)-alpha-D-glucan 1-alpha-D-glucosylmutase
MPPAIPVATYRLQLTKDFDFDAAAALIPYLKELGISHLYASPFLAARPGSTHGYDIIDHNRLNPELGGDEAFERLSSALAHADMGLILDFVPNHMGVGFSDNLWWLDVLEWGQKSPHAASFDIDWNGLPHRQQPGVLLPILGRSYADALSHGEIELKYDAASGTFAAWYFEHKLPINPQRYGEILRNIVSGANAHDEAAGQAIIGLVQPHRSPTAPSYRESPQFKRELAAIDGAADVVARGLHVYSADSDAGQLALHRLLERQHYHLSYWRIAFSAINYRRFFDINDLAGLRAENPATFRAMHGLVARLIAERKLHGLRLDHIDGLRDPAQYTRRLQELIRRIQPLPGKKPFYLLIEKILGEEEPLPNLTGVAGTTGYERLNHISHVLLDPAGLEPLDQVWRDFTGERGQLQDILTDAKRNVLETMLASEFSVLTRALSRIAAGSFATRDFVTERLRLALQAYVLAFPVYRTYIAIGGPSKQDRAVIADVIAQARANWRGPDPEIFDFLEQAINTDLANSSSYSRPRVRNFAMKLQQFTGPLMAKSLEDTAFYRYHRLLALNEVGGEPAHPDASLQTFHRRQVEAAKVAPHALTATATHDTKRGEDARMRILALAELAPEWRDAVQRWSALNRHLLRDAGDGVRQPTAAHEYMLYQSLIGAWPLGGINESFVKRMQAYAIKAAREGKQDTGWAAPNLTYEDQLSAFLRNILSEDRSAAFISDFSGFAQRTALLGALNSLSQTTLKTLLPGVPDFFQGTEFFDLSLVDPDNRRPVDYEKRILGFNDNTDWPALCAEWQSGRIKFALTRKLLMIRNAHADLFRYGNYEPVDIEGDHAEHVVAFARTWKKQRIAVLAARRFASLTNDGRTWPTKWAGKVGASFQGSVELLSERPLGATTDLRNVFGDLPVAVLPGQGLNRDLTLPRRNCPFGLTLTLTAS